jgi:hypothetical protein
MNCCRTEHDKTHVFLPPFNDCHTFANGCIAKAGLTSPGAPGGRSGAPCCAPPPTGGHRGP